MFGLINHIKRCKPEYIDFRKNYCGTCKTIGKLYGQKERILLNNDVVFLSELLAEISSCENDFKHININSCFQLPEHKNYIPVFLQYAASVNILLAYYKVMDNIEDSNSVLNIWWSIKFLQTKNFNEARKYLEKMKLPVNSIEALIREQFKRESAKKQFEEFGATLKYYSEVTGRITGEVFKHGALILDKPDLAETLYEIGNSYGEIIYLSDAIEDYKKDLKSKNFNPVLLHYAEQNTGELLQANQQAYNYIISGIAKIQDLLNLFPVSQNKIRMFVTRVSESVNRKLHKTASCNKESTKTYRKRSIREKYYYALERTQMFLPQRKQVWAKFTRYALFAGLFILIFLIFPNISHASLPDHHDKGPSCKECFEGCCNDCCSSCCDSCCEDCCNKE
jgi:tetratricopeptide (TPR) repeat protein